MKTTILAAVDLIDIEEHAVILKRAHQLAQLDEARLAVVTVVPDYGMSIVGSYFNKDAVHEAVKDVTRQLHDFVKNTLGGAVKVKHVIRTGNTYEQILKTIDELNVSLVVMGAHRPNYQDYLLGPNAARVVRHSSCSVYVMRETK